MTPKATTGQAIAIRCALAVPQDLEHGSWPERKNDRPGGESLAQRAAPSSKAWVDLSETEQVNIILRIPKEVSWLLRDDHCEVAVPNVGKAFDALHGRQAARGRAAQFPIKMP